LIQAKFISRQLVGVVKTGDCIAKLRKWDSTDRKLFVFLNKSCKANGTYFDPQENLVACADANDELLRISPKGKIEVFLPNFKGKQFNGPNDFWINGNGNIYFTDPYYKRDYWTRTAEI
jgi:gluconolactonase